MNSRPDRSILVRNLVIGAVLVAATAGLVWVWGPWRGRDADDAPEPQVVDAGPAPAAEGPEADDAATLEPLAEDAAGLRAGWAAALGAEPDWPLAASGPAACDDVREELARVCAALDRRVPALREHGGACAVIEQLALDLAAAPPDLGSELRSYETILGNVFHLFRVAGRDRMSALRGALAQPDLAEPTALALYRWATNHARCSTPAAGTVQIGREPMYAYAGFLFNTFGGQALLRRRSPRVEALACFYGLTVLDDAIREGYNPSGVDPRPEIVRCRDLVASQPLVFSSRYAAELDDMASRWKIGDGAGGGR